MVSSITVVCGMYLLWHHSCSLSPGIPCSTRNVSVLEAFPRCRPLRMNCKKWSILASALTQLSLNGPSAGIIGVPEELLVVVGSPSRRICGLHTLGKSWITRADWLRCWPGCANKGTFSSINQILSTSGCRRGLDGFDSLTVMTISLAIVTSKSKCVLMVG